MHDLFTKIVLQDGTELLGIVDFVSNKKIYMFNFAQLQEDFIILAALWAGNSSHLRFSVYCVINYPSIKLPQAIIINENNIKYSSIKLTDTEKTKQRRRMIKKD